MDESQQAAKARYEKRNRIEMASRDVTSMTIIDLTRLLGYRQAIAQQISLSSGHPKDLISIYNEADRQIKQLLSLE